MSRSLFKLDYDGCGITVTLSDACEPAVNVIPGVLGFIARQYQNHHVESIEIRQGDALSEGT